MSVYALFLPGWEDLSTWGEDDEYLYAQLTRNGQSDSDGPEIWITPPDWPELHTVDELSAVIGRVTGTEPSLVLTAMARTVGFADRRRLGLPEPGVELPGGADERTEPESRDLAANVAGIGVTHEAVRRRESDGAGADRSWRVGADGEATVAELLTPLTVASRWDRWRGRGPRGFVLHSVPLGNGRGQVRGDVDHLLVGPPGVVTINTKHHRGGQIALDGDQLILNGYATDYVPKARREAQRVADFLRAGLAAVGAAELAARVPVRPLIAIVGGRLLVDRWPSAVTVTLARNLVEGLMAFPQALSKDEVEAVYALARRSLTWNPIVDA